MKKIFDIKNNRLFGTCIFILLFVVLGATSPVYGAGEFSVTVPLSLPVDMDEAGKVFTSSNAYIANNSVSTVEVVDVYIDTKNGWSISDYNDSYNEKSVNAKEFGILINEGIANPDGSISFMGNVDLRIASGRTMDIIYDVRLPAQEEAINNELMADVVFVLDWENGSPPAFHEVIFRAGVNGTLDGGSPQVMSDILEGDRIVFPTPLPYNGYAFLHWIDIDTSQVISPDSPIESTMTLEAVFKSTRQTFTTDEGHVINIATGVISDYVGTSTTPTIPASYTVDGVSYPLTTVADSAYASKGLTGITIEEGIETIEKSAFQRNPLSNDGTATLFIPSSVTYIGNQAFRECGLAKNGVTVDNESSNISIDGNAFMKNGSKGNYTITASDILFLQDTQVLSSGFELSQEDIVINKSSSDGESFEEVVDKIINDHDEPALEEIETLDKTDAENDEELQEVDIQEDIVNAEATADGAITGSVGQDDDEIVDELGDEQEPLDKVVANDPAEVIVEGSASPKEEDATMQEEE